MGQAPSHHPSLDVAPRARSRGPSPAPPTDHRKPSHGTRKKSLELPDLTTKLALTPHLRSPPPTSAPIPIRGQPPPDHDRERINRFNHTHDSLLDVPDGNMNDVLPAPQYHHPPSPHTQSPQRAGWRPGYHAPPSSLVARSPSAVPPSPRPVSPAPPPAHASPVHKRRSPKKTAEHIYSTIPLGVSKGKARAVDVTCSTATVPTRIVWRGGGVRVELAGTFDRDWQGRRTLAWDPTARTHVTTVDLRPGTHRLKFIVDDQWKCANDLPTAVDNHGNLVNYVEVSEESVGEAVLGWEKGLTGAPEDLPPWTSEIPPHLIQAAQLEEQYLARRMEPDAPSPPLIPHPPALPRHLEKVILNARTTGNAASASGVGKSVAAVGGVGAITSAGAGAGTGGADDNSVLPVPNHVVLNHLGTSAIKGGVLAVGTTTRYHRKYITTIYYKPVS